MEAGFIKIAPTVYEILESTIRAAIDFTEADAGHIFLIKPVDRRLFVSHQCLVTDHGEVIRQYQEDRPFIYGPCQRSIEERKMYYVHDARTNALHQLLLAELRRMLERGQPGSLKRKYLEDYFDFLAKARSYISVPIKRLNLEPIGALALYSYASEDYFGAMRKRIIEEYMDNFASALITSLIEKASQENQRLKELLESHGERSDAWVRPGNMFDAQTSSEFQGVGHILEQLLSQAGRAPAWTDVLSEFERFLICFALERTKGQVQRAFTMLRMPKRTFYNKVKQLGIDLTQYRRRPPAPARPSGAG